MPPPRIVELSKKINEFLQDWGLERKVVSITLGNASDVLQNTLRSQLLQIGLICGGEFFHVHCYIHILNLIVQEELKVFGDSLNHIRNNIKYVRRFRK